MRFFITYLLIIATGFAQTLEHIEFDVYDRGSDFSLNGLLQKDMSEYSGIEVTATTKGYQDPADGRGGHHVYDGTKWTTPNGAQPGAIPHIVVDVIGHHPNNTPPADFDDTQSQLEKIDITNLPDKTTAFVRGLGTPGVHSTDTVQLLGDSNVAAYSPNAGFFYFNAVSQKWRVLYSFDDANTLTNFKRRTPVFYNFFTTPSQTHKRARIKMIDDYGQDDFFFSVSLYQEDYTNKYRTQFNIRVYKSAQPNGWVYSISENGTRADIAVKISLENLEIDKFDLVISQANKDPLQSARVYQFTISELRYDEPSASITARFTSSLEDELDANIIDGTAVSDIRIIGLNPHNIPYLDADGKIPISALPFEETENTDTSFPDAAARFVAVPDIAGQYATQQDTDVTYVSTGTAAGDWEIYNPGKVTFGQRFNDSDLIRCHGKRGDGYGQAGVIKDGDVYFWGRRYSDGQFPLPLNNDRVRNVRKWLTGQAIDYPNPDYDSWNSSDDPVVDLRFFDSDFGMARTQSGIMFSWHRGDAEISRMGGQDPTTDAQNVARPLMFGTGITSAKIASWDAVSYYQGAEDIAKAVFLDETGQDWYLWHAFAGYGVHTIGGLTGSQDVPARPFVSVDRVKNQVTNSGFFVKLQSNNFFMSGFNSSGIAGQGNQLNMNNYQSVANMVRDFSVFMGSMSSSTEALAYINTSDELYGTGDGTSGWFGVGSTNDQLSPQLIATDVKRAWLGGGGYKTLIYERNNGEIFGAGDNQYGILGTGSYAGTNSSDIRLTEIETIAANNEGILDIMIGARSVDSPSICFILCGNGKVFSAGRNDVGQLGRGLSTATRYTTFGEVVAQLGKGEVFVEMGHFIDTTGRPHVGLISNISKVYMAGRRDWGFATGEDYGADEYQLSFEEIVLPE